MKRFFPVAVFLAVALVSLVLAGYAYLVNDDATRIKFEGIADDAVNRIESRIELHVSLLHATQALFETRGGDVSRLAFKSFYDAFDVEHNYAGLRGVGVLRVAHDDAELAAVEEEVKRNFGAETRVHPVSTAKLKTPIVLFEPLATANIAAMGFDMYSEPQRQAVIDAALASDAPEATGRLTLGQTSGAPYPGFLIFQRLDLGPTEAEDGSGLLFLAFRAAELFNAALSRAPLLPVNVEAYDGEPAPERLMFRSEAPPTSDMIARRDISVAGVTWTLLFRPTSGFTAPASQAIPLVVGLIGLLLAGAVALIARYQSRAYDAMAALQETAERTLLEKDLLLQEMKHRIKNSIARILAIARQTASSASDIEEFSGSFASRLQAMAASQDMLTRSRWQKGELGDLLAIELGQVFGKELPPEMLSGPKALLDEAATQALGLTFHELATNAMKYGDITGLRVRWRIEREPQGRRLHLVWEESGQATAAPEKVGFGTRLIDMNITRELGGTIARDFGPDGLSVTIAIPLRT